MKLIKFALFFACLVLVTMGILYRFFYAFTSPKTDALIWGLVVVAMFILHLLTFQKVTPIIRRRTGPLAAERTT